MAETGKSKTEKQVVAEEMAEAAANTKDEVTYHLDEHIQLAYPMYGVATNVVAGAATLIPGNKKNFTKAEMTAAITAFNKHKVENN